jgi:AcrR family transcriptional regulator
MRAVARRAQIPTMTIYGYFPSKVALIRSLWSLAFDPLFEALQAVAAEPAEPAERLAKVAQAYVRYWCERPDLYRMVFLVEDTREEGDGGWFVEQTDVIQSYLLVERLIAKARGMQEGDCLRQGEALICALTGVAHMAVTVSEYPWGPPEDYAAILAHGMV